MLKQKLCALTSKRALVSGVIFGSVTSESWGKVGHDGSKGRILHGAGKEGRI